MKSFGQQVIVTFNRFATDTDEEIALVAEHCEEKGVGFAMNNVFAEGGEGGTELARLVVDTIENHPSAPLQYTYDLNDPIRTKVQKWPRRYTELLRLFIRLWPIKNCVRSKAWVFPIIRSVSPRLNIHSLPIRKLMGSPKISN